MKKITARSHHQKRWALNSGNGIGILMMGHVVNGDDVAVSHLKDCPQGGWRPGWNGEGSASTIGEKNYHRCSGKGHGHTLRILLVGIVMN